MTRKIVITPLAPFKFSLRAGLPVTEPKHRESAIGFPPLLNASGASEELRIVETPLGKPASTRLLNSQKAPDETNTVGF
ncbi:MAG: hypothetical protein VYA34_06080 [Myxococcota bacterium]|nr:hypothetical protein [Myxococcota bacterium]